jgi:hypothetical protein
MKPTTVAAIHVHSGAQPPATVRRRSTTARPIM